MAPDATRIGYSRSNRRSFVGLYFAERSATSPGVKVWIFPCRGSRRRGRPLEEDPAFLEEVHAPLELGSSARIPVVLTRATKDSRERRGRSAGDPPVRVRAFRAAARFAPHQVDHPAGALRPVGLRLEHVGDPFDVPPRSFARARRSARSEVTELEEHEDPSIFCFSRPNPSRVVGFSRGPRRTRRGRRRRVAEGRRSLMREKRLACSARGRDPLEHPPYFLEELGDARHVQTSVRLAYGRRLLFFADRPVFIAIDLELAESLEDLAGELPQPRPACRRGRLELERGPRSRKWRA